MCPALQDIVTGMRSALTLIRRYLPEDLVTHIYVDEQPEDAGNYVAGACHPQPGGCEHRRLRVLQDRAPEHRRRQYWSQETPASMTAEAAKNFDFSAKVEVDGSVLADPVVT